MNKILWTIAGITLVSVGLLLLREFKLINLSFSWCLFFPILSYVINTIACYIGYKIAQIFDD